MRTNQRESHKTIPKVATYQERANHQTAEPSSNKPLSLFQIVPMPLFVTIGTLIFLEFLINNRDFMNLFHEKSFLVGQLTLPLGLLFLWYVHPNKVKLWNTNWINWLGILAFYPIFKNIWQYAPVLKLYRFVSLFRNLIGRKSSMGRSNLK